MAVSWRQRVERQSKSPIAVGFFMVAAIALFIRFGIIFVLFLLNRWQISVINTLIFYGLLFIIAKIGMRRKKPTVKNSDRAYFPESLDKEYEEQSTLTAILSKFWTAYALFSILWITPAFILYWIDTAPYPNEMIQLFVWVLGSITGIMYFITNGKKFPRKSDKIMFFIGGFGGLATVVCLTF